MKKVFLATLLSLFAVAAMAQYRPTFVVSAGYQGGNIHVNDNSYDNKMKSGFRVGVSADFPVYNFGTGELSILPGLYYSTKGIKVETSILGQKLSTNKVNLGYLELPILANVRFNVTNDINVFVNAGPYLAYGVYSGSSVKGKLIDTEEGGDLDIFKKAFKENGAFKPFDAGIQVGAGAEYRRIQLAVGGQFGLANINRNFAPDKLKATNSTFFVTLGYRF